MSAATVTEVEVEPLPARVPRDERGRSPWIADVGELVARARVLLLDTGVEDAPTLSQGEVARLWLRLAADALEAERTPLEHAAFLKVENRRRLTAPECSRCGARRPQFRPSYGWRSIDGAAACPACLKVHRLIGARS